MKRWFLSLSLLLCSILASAQFTYGTTGLLHAPTADMQRDGTLMIGGSFLNKRNLPNNRLWGYDSFNYYVNITFLKRLEIAYICTLLKGKKENKYWPEQTWGRFVNQDRSFSVRIQLVKEKELWKYMPGVVIGVNDPTTGSGGDYFNNISNIEKGNGYFNRWYVAITKHFETPYGELGTHVAYLYNRRVDYPLNGPAFGINFRPNIHKNLNLIAEYDAKTFNIGATYSLWAEHLNFVLELQKCRYISAGFVYKVNLLGGNKWNSKFFE